MNTGIFNTIHEKLSLKSNSAFAVSVICIAIGASVRLAYCVFYPVQPRDAYIYEQTMENWGTSGKIPTTSYFPLSLWILKIPHQYFQLEAMKGGILINILLGLFIIAFSVKIANRFFKNFYITLSVGIIAATHPDLVFFSCSCLRENTYLAFSLLVLYFFALYYREPNTFYLVLSSIFAAFAFLCILEGFEFLAIFSFLLLFLCIYKKVFFFKAVIHGIIFMTSFFLTICMTCFCLGFKLISWDDITTRFL